MVDICSDRTKRLRDLRIQASLEDRFIGSAAVKLHSERLIEEQMRQCKVLSKQLMDLLKDNDASRLADLNGFGANMNYVLKVDEVFNDYRNRSMLDEEDIKKLQQPVRTAYQNLMLIKPSLALQEPYHSMEFLQILDLHEVRKQLQQSELLCALPRVLVNTDNAKGVIRRISELYGVVELALRDQHQSAAELLSRVTDKIKAGDSIAGCERLDLSKNETTCLGVKLKAVVNIAVQQSWYNTKSTQSLSAMGGDAEVLLSEPTAYFNPAGQLTQPEAFDHLVHNLMDVGCIEALGDIRRVGLSIMDTSLSILSDLKHRMDVINTLNEHKSDGLYGQALEDLAIYLSEMSVVITTVFSTISAMITNIVKAQMTTDQLAKRLVVFQDALARYKQQRSTL